MNQADYNELVFLEDCRKLLKEEGFHKTHPLNEDPLPRAQPCMGFMATHKLEYDPVNKIYTPVPITQEYERQ